MRSNRSTAGFTLIELMMVIVIFSILMTVAVVSYTENIGKARSREALEILTLTSGRQVLYFQRFSTYLDTGSFDVSYWPRPLTGTLRPWGIDCDAIGLPAEQQAWCDLGVKPVNQLFYAYNTAGWNIGKTGAPFGIPSTETWWVVTAWGDRDGDGVYSTFRLHSHAGGRVFIQNELE